MKVISLVLIALLIGAAGVGAVVARPESTEDMAGSGITESGMVLQSQDQNQDRDREIYQNQTVVQTWDPICDEEGYSPQNQSCLNNGTPLQNQIEERRQEQTQEQTYLSDEDKQVLNQYAYANAFVYVLQHQNGALGDCAANASQVAMQLEQSLRTEAQAQITLENRHMFMRTLFGGDEVAAGLLQQEAVRSQQSIQEMIHMIAQSPCDPQLHEELRDQLQQMEQQQIQLQQLAHEELQQKGLVGWLWK